MRVLFVTWDGPAVSYLEGLYIPIFAELRSRGVSFDVLQFRWGAAAHAEAARDLCNQQGIGYTSVRVPRSPARIAPFVTSALGGRYIRRASRRYRSDIIMPRGLLPALSTLAFGAAKHQPILFDADGLEADERVEFGGLTENSPAHRALKAVEAEMVRRSTAVLVRAEAAIDVLRRRSGGLRERRNFHVMPNGRDPKAFSPSSPAERLRIRSELGVSPSAPVAIYVGSVGGGKYRMDEVAHLFGHMSELHPDARLLLLSGSPEEARRLILTADPSLEETAIFKRVEPAAVPRYISAADVGLMFITPSESMRAVAPIKLSEYLLCGVPVVGTAEVGETSKAMEDGVFFPRSRSLWEAAQWVVGEVLPAREDFRERTRMLGLRQFSISNSADALEAALRDVMERNGRRSPN